MKKQRRQYAPEEKVAILRRHLLEKEPISKLCDEVGTSADGLLPLAGMTHVRTSPYYPQSNGEIERWHKSLKGECIRPGTPLSLEDARRLVERYVEHYNDVRLNSAIGYVIPKDMLAGRQHEIHAERDRRLQEARRQRQIRRQQAA